MQEIESYITIAKMDYRLFMITKIKISSKYEHGEKSIKFFLNLGKKCSVQNESGDSLLKRKK